MRVGAAEPYLLTTEMNYKVEGMKLCIFITLCCLRTLHEEAQARSFDNEEKSNAGNVSIQSLKLKYNFDIFELIILGQRGVNEESLSNDPVAVNSQVGKADSEVLN